MATAQDIFDTASREYRKAEELINRLSLLAKKADSSFNTSVPMRQYDILLQAMLLHVIIIDKKIQGTEVSFVKQIVDHADIFELLREKMGMPIDWNTLKFLSPENMDKTAALCDRIAQEIGSNFIEIFAIMDAAIDRVSIIDELGGYTKTILGGAMLIDGDMSREEVAAGSVAVDMLLIDPWKKIVSDISKREANTSRTSNFETASNKSNPNYSGSSSNSLKDVYLKKKLIN